MTNTTVKVRIETRDRIKALSAELQLSADAVISTALEELERTRLWAEWHNAYQALTPTERNDYREEQAIYDGASSDGLQ